MWCNVCKLCLGKSQGLVVVLVQLVGTGLPLASHRNHLVVGTGCGLLSSKIRVVGALR